MTVYGPGGARRLRLGPQGSFITVYAGYVEDVRPQVVIDEPDGHTVTINLGDSLVQQAAEPAGGPPWDVLGGANTSPGAPDDEECVQVQRESSPPEPGVAGEPTAFQLFGGAETPQYCGRLAAHVLFVAIERFDPDQKPNGGAWYWQQVPARTIVYGAAGPRVSALWLTVGSGTPRSLAINRDDGAFAAVLDGRTSPTSLVLTAQLHDGQRLTFDRSANLLSESGRPVRSLPEPPYRPLRPLHVQQPPAFASVITSTIDESLHSADPSGGPAWTLESWQATRLPVHEPPHVHIYGPAPPGRYFCENAGVRQHGELVQPNLTGPATPLTTNPDGACGDPHAASLFNEVYVNSVDSYAPTPVRDIVYGFVQPGSTDVRLSAHGVSRALPIDRNGGFLTVLPGSFWHTTLHVTALSPTGRPETATDRPQRGAAPLPFDTDAPLAIAPDPAGGPPWGFRAGPADVQMIGQVIGGRLVSLQPNGILAVGPVEFGGVAGESSSPSPLNLYTGQLDSPATLALGRTSALTRAEIERRTLPGVTLIAGLALSVNVV
ncbi:MAG: hypothetical protein ACLP22_25095 [Solirubrobacteraceae bacterium]